MLYKSGYEEGRRSHMYWLLKTEPQEYSWGDLKREGEITWDGVNAPVALKNLSRMKVGEGVLIYHTGRERAVVGTAEVTAAAFPDPVAQDPRLLVVRVRAANSLPRPVTLKEIKDSDRFPDWELVRLPRLSVVPVDSEQWETVLQWGRMG